MTARSGVSGTSAISTAGGDVFFGSSSWDSYFNDKGMEEIVLPGYEAGSDQSGIEHSQLKLRGSAKRLFAKLGKIQTSNLDEQSTEVSDEQSTEVSDEQSTEFSKHRSLTVIGGVNGSGSIQTFHCQEEKETWAYRCRCNFQIVRVVLDGAATATATPSLPVSTSYRYAYRYAMRSMGKPVLLGTKNSFPIATRRIQTAMDEFMEHLNKHNAIGDVDPNAGNGNININSDGGSDGQQDLMGHNGHLTSCTFSSAWRDTPDADCVLTLHYDHPLDRDGNSKKSWNRRARLLCRKLRLRQLNGRSKGTLLSVKGEEISKNVSDENDEDDDDDEAEATIRDTIYLLQSGCEESKDEMDCAMTQDEWKVTLDNTVPPDANSTVVIPVHYDKPETAFYHPNSNAMTTALAWMLNRLANMSSSPNQKLNILEMYCGCGAHTVALGRSGLVSNILAVELDPRLVRACEVNVARNSLQDLVEVRRGDAGRWAKEESRKRRSRRGKNLAVGNEADRQTSNKENYYDALLVDPPRQGLDEEVCRMAMMSIDGEVGGGTSAGCFRNVLYVSCGHQALLRDLERLSPVYEVINCAQMDLFPRTDSIETLVHLRRRNS